MINTKTKEELAQSYATRLVVKRDLEYPILEEEQNLLSEMTPDEICMVRKNILNSIRYEDLCIDVFEDYLNDLKDAEYRRYLAQEGASMSVESQMERLAYLEGKCNQMVINIAKGASNVEGLLGPNIHDTYGVHSK